MAPLPKRRHSRARARKRESGKRKPLLPSLNNVAVCPNCKKPILPHRICPSCGFYRGKKQTN